MSNPTHTAAWQSLQAHSAQFKLADFSLRRLFQVEHGRFNRFSLTHDELLLDFSRNLITSQTLDRLVALAEAQQVPAAIAAMFAGANINPSEQRPALHVALREPAAYNRFREVTDTLQRMDALVTATISGNYRGCTGKAITDLVNLGVGGSDLGPALAVSALKNSASQDTAKPPPRVHFVSNIDPLHIESTLSGLNPETTLFIVASKSFTTLETLHNAHAARLWLTAQSRHESAPAIHFLAVTANRAAALAFGIKAEHVFPMWDWTGGRFSLWSAIGLPVAFALGMESFRQLLAGAHSMDQHFRHAPLPQNMPVLLALLSVWYRAFFDSHSSAVIPYSQALHKLPAYLQQLSMESLGKCVNLADEPIAYATGDPQWGVVGTDAQHSCLQMLHQGTNLIPVDFIVAAKAPSGADKEAHQQLFANCLSQSLALMEGVADATAPYRSVPGNKPSNTLLLKELNPYNLGSLLALYEHKIYVQSVIWNINAFDQWGVELGKSIATQLLGAVRGNGGSDGGNDDSSNNNDVTSALDDSTLNLITCANNWNAQQDDS